MLAPCAQQRLTWPTTPTSSTHQADPFGDCGEILKRKAQVLNHYIDEATENKNDDTEG